MQVHLVGLVQGGSELDYFSAFYYFTVVRRREIAAPLVPKGAPQAPPVAEKTRGRRKFAGVYNSKVVECGNKASFGGGGGSLALVFSVQRQWRCLVLQVHAEF